jgi:hypothetical protein
VPAPHSDDLQLTACPSRQCSSRRRSGVVTRDSSSASNVSTISNRLQAQPADSTAQQQQQNDQEIKGLKQLVAQQQSLIQALQADVHELRGMLVQPAGSSNSSSNSSSSSEQGPSSWHQQTTVPIIAPPPPASAQQQQQQPQPQSQPSQPSQQAKQPQQHSEHSGGYQPMSIETFQSLPDKIILVRHAESLGNVDATTYSNTPDYEVRGTEGTGGKEQGGRSLQQQEVVAHSCTTPVRCFVYVCAWTETACLLPP